ncbi:recombinase family protein [Burkholderia cepacia]|uniref:recombinase family protein n=1 Tax=Burkholderia cepacia TaxID=292 RepID=UPI0007551B3A|nr:recombinase family protein [Burkholderia cepacia]KVA50895.1 serine recombinase [Burkholderia cepacia]KVC22013.1 serine recombinase [Burkholderia cepacia]
MQHSLAIEEESADKRIPVARYTRMSTEHQRYSTENQAQFIAEFASTHGMDIVRSYQDDGKSGLNIEGRQGLRSLLQDVQSRNTDFVAVLVYDVSRWGRFPDPDEAAVYEQTCKRNGVQVIYCAEQFGSDTSLGSTLLKSLKRSMAAEYSRELSVKVFAGHRNLVQRGYRQGGIPGFGLQRQLIDENHVVKGLLHHGEKKSIQTDRIVLVPGPAEDVATVHRIYRLFLDQGMPERVIASHMNREGVLNHGGRPWTRGTIHQILTNEKYIGNNVYNRTSFKLKMQHVRNPPEQWIRKDGAFDAIVPADWYYRVQAIIANRSRHLDDGEMLAALASILGKYGALSGLIIDEEDNAPSSAAYRSRFGSLLRAYSLVGFTPQRDYSYLEINRALRQRYPAVLKEIQVGIEKSGGFSRRDGETDLLDVNGEFTVSLVIARCKMTPAGSYRWRVRLDTSLSPDITIVARMNHDNTKPYDFYLLPSIDFTPALLPCAEYNGFALDVYQFETLELFYRITARLPLAEAI